MGRRRSSFWTELFCCESCAREPFEHAFLVLFLVVSLILDLDVDVYAEAFIVEAHVDLDMAFDL